MLTKCSYTNSLVLPVRDSVPWGMFMPKLCVVLPPADRAQLARCGGKRKHATETRGAGADYVDAGGARPSLAHCHALRMRLGPARQTLRGRAWWFPALPATGSRKADP